MINRPEGWHDGKSIKEIREKNKADINAFVLRLQRHDADCTMDAYEDIENDIMCQSEITEMAIRKIENMKIGDKRMMFCYDECNKETIHELIKKHVAYSIGNKMIDGFVLIWECQECHDGWFEDDYAIIQKDVLLQKIKKHLLSGNELKKIREDLKMRRSEFVDLMNQFGGNMDIETYEEIESDYEIQSKEIDGIIRKIAKFNK